jgi:hypothetical protein
MDAGGRRDGRGREGRDGGGLRNFEDLNKYLF